MRPTDVEGVGLMAPLGAALSAGQGMGPIFLGGPLRLPHVVLAVAFDPSCGGGKRILAAEVSLKRLAQLRRRRCRARTSTSSCSTARARLFAAGSRGGVGTLETAARARRAARASCRRARSSPSTSTAAVA